MNKRLVLRVVGAVLVLAAASVAVAQFKGLVVSWYADRFIPRSTVTPGTEHPDQICLTWSDDPRTTQTVQWRTSPTVTQGWLEYVEANQPDSSAQGVAATMSVWNDPMIKNDPVNHRFHASMQGLRPGTEYRYRVGTGQQGPWSDWATFTTAPDAAQPFSFVYMGDPQLGLDQWGMLLQQAGQRHPNAAFYVISGDLVNDGAYRNEFDEFFAGGRGVFDHRPLVPCLGNHDYASELHPHLYLETFQLPLNGPKDFPPERAYWFEYANALFVVLDSNISPTDQAPWLEERLANTKATWKFVVYHHPLYPSKKHRDNEDIREAWEPLFDKYHVDLALEGHDHAYLRTYPMRDGKRVESTKEGTVHVVSVSGTKYYEQVEHDYAEKAFTNTSTYQVIDISTNPDRLTYRCYDLNGKILDEFAIER